MNRDQLTCRRAQAHDLPRLAAINAELIANEWDGVSRSLSFLESRLTRWIDDPEYLALVFESGGEFAGYVLVRVYPDEAYIRHFYVSPAMRGTGVGKSMLRILFDEHLAAGIRVSLDVLSTNVSGVAFWRSSGFRDYSVMMERYTPSRTEDEKPPAVPVGCDEGQVGTS